MVALHDITSCLPDKSDTEQRQAKDFLQREFLHVVTLEMSLGDALQSFLEHQGECLPVVRSKSDQELLDAVYKTSPLDAYFCLDRAQELHA